MNRKQFFMVLLALAIVGGAGLVLLHRNQDSWMVHEASEGDKVLPGFPINDVAVIHVKGGGADFHVVHANDLWCVRERGDYPANFAMIRDFLFKLRDLKVVQSDLIGPSQLTRLDLAPPGPGTNTATLIEFKDAQGKLLAALLLGKKHPRPQLDSEPLGLHGLFDGRYVLLPGDPHNALLVSDVLAAAIPVPGLWLSQTFFKANHIKYISMISPDPDNSWEISRADEASPWTLDNARPAEVLNTNAASIVSQILYFPNFDDVTPKTAALLAGPDFARPFIVTILTDYFAYTLKIGRREPDGEHLMTVSIEGSIPTKRVSAPGEPPGDQAQLDADFQGRIQSLRTQLAQGQALAPWIFQVGPWIEKVICNRSRLLEPSTTASGQTASQ